VVIESLISSYPRIWLITRIYTIVAFMDVNMSQEEAYRIIAVPGSTTAWSRTSVMRERRTYQ
jgi:hypothetical protein